MNYLKGKSYHWHALLGAGMSFLADRGHVVPWFTFVAVLLAGFLHELGDDCFNKAKKPQAPLSGILDTLAFIPIPLIIWLKALL